VQTELSKFIEGLPQRIKVVPLIKLTKLTQQERIVAPFNLQMPQTTSFHQKQMKP
jgi:hypothetical protein